MAIKHLRNFLFEKTLLELGGHFGFIPAGMVRDVALFTTAASIPTSVYQKGFVGLQHLVGAPLARIHTPHVKPGSARLASPGLRTAPVRNYGVSRIGGRMLGTTFGALMIAEAILPSLQRFRPEQRID